MEPPQPAAWKPIQIMNLRFLIILPDLLLASLLYAAEVKDFEYGQRPQSSVFDPESLLDSKVVAQIADPLNRISREKDVDIIVVVLSDIGIAPPEHVATRFADAWCKESMHAVVLHVPAHKESPWIIPGGTLIDPIKPELIHKQVADAMRRATREPKEAGKVIAAATEAADILQFWKGNVTIRNESISQARHNNLLQAKTWHSTKRVMILGGAALGLLMMMGILWLAVTIRRKKPGPRTFPERTPPRRLGAPHAGGNHVVISLGPPLVVDSNNEPGKQN